MSTVRRKPKLDEDEVKNIANEVIEERLNPDMESIFGENERPSSFRGGSRVVDSFDDENTDDEDELAQEVSAADSFDIFDDVINKFAQGGSLLKFYIFKNGEQVASRQGKYSWEEVQEEFGGGTFKIVVKRPNGLFFKQQARHLANPEQFKKGRGEQADTGIKDILTTMMQMNNAQNERFEKLLSKKEQDSKAEGNQTVTMMSTMMNTMAQMFSQPKSDNSLEFMKMMMDMNNKAQERTEKLIESMNRSMKETVEALSSKDDDSQTSPLELWKEIQEAERRGREAEREAFEKMERRLKERENELKQDEGKKSLTDRVIESALPALLAGTMKQANTLPAPIAQSRPARPTVSRPTKMAASSIRQEDDLPRAGVKKPASKTETSRGTIPSKDASPKTSQTAKFDPQHEDFENLGDNLTEIPMDEEIVAPKEQTSEKWWLDENGAPRNYVGSDSHGNMLDEQGMDAEDLLTRTLLPIIGQAIMSEQRTDEAVENALEQIVPLGFEPDELERLFTKGKIFQLTETSGVFAMAEQQGKESDLIAWLGGFYDQLVQTYRDVFAVRTNQTT